MEEEFSELVVRLFEIVNYQVKRIKRQKTEKEQRFRDLWYDNKRSTIHIIGVAKKRRKR